VVVGAAQVDARDEVDELSQALLVERGAGVVLGEHALQGGVVALDRGHRLVHQFADVRLTRVLLKLRPASLGGHPEDVLRPVLVGVLWVGALVALGFELGVMGLEGVGDVLKEDEPQHNVLVLGGIHRAAQGVGGGPELSLEAQVGGGGIGSAQVILFLRHFSHHFIISSERHARGGLSMERRFFRYCANVSDTMLMCQIRER